LAYTDLKSFSPPEINVCTLIRYINCALVFSLPLGSILLRTLTKPLTLTGKVHSPYFPNAKMPYFLIWRTFNMVIQSPNQIP